MTFRLSQVLAGVASTVAVVGLLASTSVTALAWNNSDTTWSYACVSATSIRVTATLHLSGKRNGETAVVFGAPGATVHVDAASFTIPAGAGAPCAPKPPPPPPPPPPPVVIPPPHVTPPPPPPPVPCKEDEQHPNGTIYYCVPKPPKHVECGKGEEHPKGDEQHCVPVPPVVKPTPTPTPVHHPIASQPRENLPPPSAPKVQAPPAAPAAPVAPTTAKPVQATPTNVPGPPVTGSGPDNHPVALANTATNPVALVALVLGLLLIVGTVGYWLVTSLRRRATA